MHDSFFREVRRVTNLLLQIKRYEWKMEAREKDDEEDGSAGFSPALAVAIQSSFSSTGDAAPLMIVGTGSGQRYSIRVLSIMY